MNMRLPIAFVLAGFVGAGGFVAAMNAQAQQSMPQQATPVDPQAGMQQHDHGRDREGGRFSPADRAAFFDARVAALHAGLTLTPDQDKLWPAVETALRDAAKTMAERRKMWHDTPRPSDPVQMLQRISEGSLARGQALKKLADAAAPLYATLNDEQKHRLPILLAHLHPHGMHFAMMGGMGGEEHNSHDGGDERGHGWSHDRHGYGEDEGHDEDGGHHMDH